MADVSNSVSVPTVTATGARAAIDATVAEAESLGVRVVISACWPWAAARP
jgi:hypothetical protein